MRVVRISKNGVELGIHAHVVRGRRERYQVLTHGEVGRGRYEWRLPLGSRDFPAPPVPTLEPYRASSMDLGNPVARCPVCGQRTEPEGPGAVYPIGQAGDPCPRCAQGGDGSFIERLSLIQRGEGRYLGVAEHPADINADLVFWHLSPGFRGGATYYVDGEAQVLGEGYEAEGIAGRMGGAPCPVVAASGPATLHWRREGRLYGEPSEWVASRDEDGEWFVAPLAEFEEEKAATSA